MAQPISKMETTAVEWLMKEWPALKYQLPAWLIEQAKAMEKEQILTAFFEGTCDWRKPYLENIEKAEKYYKVTYGDKDM